METKVEKQNETATIVNGVVLTEEALKELKSLQDYNNDYINHCVEQLADIVCGFAIDPGLILQFGLSDPTKAVPVLSALRGILKNLRKP